MPHTQKLFPSYGSAIANALARAAWRDGIVRRFILRYAEENERRAVAANAKQVSELEQTIGREALLAMTIEVRAQLPRFFGKRRGASLAGDAQAATDAFFREYFSSLGRAGDWPLEEAAQFQRDLGLYARMSPGEQRIRSAGGFESPTEPFADRCAILLDPSMMEKARRAAAGFHTEMIRATEKILSETLRLRPSR
ncbi:MAG TPA: hypothetical protein VEH50_11655 [Methylomirabilota bacterium]|jgi:hypothetical protein|nr:hypothetical protein [Methylomirabilota bacterium]